MYKKIAILFALLAIVMVGFSQLIPQSPDSAFSVKYLPDITIVGKGSKSDYQPLPAIVGTNIYAGKKSSLIILDNVQGNIVNNTMRQVLSKVSGIHIWESDPSGIQIGIAARGLSPNRSWEFNVRQNGYDIAADPFGYPEAYYNPQLEAVQRIEIIRGQGSLQYGPQFGGMINYILRNGSEIKKPLELETRQTIGSNSTFNAFMAAGGNTKRIHYYAFLNHRNGDGWRQNSRFFSNAEYGTITYHLLPGLSITAELMQSHIRSQQPGGLTDSILQADSKISLRSRNWFDITWTIPALNIQYENKKHFRLNTKIFAVIGNRNSVGFLKNILISDSIQATTDKFSERLLNIDQYRNYAMESRILKEYRALHFTNTFSAGIRLYTGKTYRRADGKGSTGADYTMDLTGSYLKNINFRSKNMASFIENIIWINKKLSIIPGLRYEWIQGSAAGINGIDSIGKNILIQQISRSRQFILTGIGTEYKLTNKTEIYTSFAQAYRPIQFANLQAAPTTDIVDSDLKDSKGYNFDFGYRGNYNNILQFDISAFLLQYNNRVGIIYLPQGQRLITNIGASTSKGIESFIWFNLLRAIKRNSGNELSFFSNYSYTDARYDNNLKDQSIKGNKIENAPVHIFRGGMTLGFPRLSFTAQISYTGSTYSDANNTITPSSNGQTGLIPAYSILDLSAGFKISSNLTIKTGINNILSETYFTRRAGGYPGPGALPGDGRTGFFSIYGKF